MDRESALLLALGMLVVASLTVGVTGWILLLRDRRLARAVVRRSDAAEGP
jgi:hypothetical protein